MMVRYLIWCHIVTILWSNEIKPDGVDVVVREVEGAKRRCADHRAQVGNQVVRQVELLLRFGFQWVRGFPWGGEDTGRGKWVESKVLRLLQMQNEYVENRSRSSLWEDWGQDSLAWTSSESLISNDFKSVSPALAGQWDRWSGWSGCCRPWGWSGRAGWTRGCPRRSTWGWLLWGQEIILAMIPDERFWSELSMNFQPFQISWLENLLRYALTKCMYVGIYCKWTKHGEIFYSNRQYLSDRSKKNNWRARYQWTIWYNTTYVMFVHLTFYKTSL